ncbi:MAG: ribonuclease P protein component [Natronohydrobacter sp.]|nr:ribonuclease P protein component [Natronohydrobacter sp.]
MTPPGADVARQDAEAAVAPAVLSCLMPATLLRRADFLRAAKARRVPCPAFLLQARARDDAEAVRGARIGYTCTKKLGNAVTRNRAKRRLRAVSRAVLPQHARDGWDYVLIGRPGATVSHDFAAMCADLERALRKLHGGTL